MTDPRVDEATSPATAEDLRRLATALRMRQPVFDLHLSDRLVALAAIRDSERATREAAVIDAALAWYEGPSATWSERDFALIDAASALYALRLPTSPEPEERRAAERAVLDAAVALVEWWDPRDTDEWAALQAAVRTLVLLHKA